MLGRLALAVEPEEAGDPAHVLALLHPITHAPPDIERLPASRDPVGDLVRQVRLVAQSFEEGASLGGCQRTRVPESPPVLAGRLTVRADRGRVARRHDGIAKRRVLVVRLFGQGGDACAVRGPHGAFRQLREGSRRELHPPARWDPVEDDPPGQLVAEKEVTFALDEHAPGDAFVSAGHLTQGQEEPRLGSCPENARSFEGGATRR